MVNTAVPRPWRDENNQIISRVASRYPNVRLIDWQNISEGHPEFNLKRNYIELLVSLPFGKRSEDTYSIAKSAEILNESHFGMDKVKSRILEFLAVSKLKENPTGKADWHPTRQSCRGGAKKEVLRQRKSIIMW